MSDTDVTKSDDETNGFPLLQSGELSAEQLYQIEIGARAILRAQEIQAQKDVVAEKLAEEQLDQIEIGARAILRAQEIQAQKDKLVQRLAEAEKWGQVGIYNVRRSLLMPVTDYVKLLGFIIFAGALYIGIQAFLEQAYANNTQLLGNYKGQLMFGAVVFFVALTWLVVRIYHIWALDYVYADVNHIRRTRRPIWYLGIRMISFEVPTKSARCNVEPTNLEIALRNIKFDASSIDIDTNIDHDEPLHNLKFIKDAGRLESIINSVS